MISLYSALVIYALSLLFCKKLMDKAGVEKIYDDMGATNIFNYKWIAYTFALVPAWNTIMCVLCIVTMIEERIKMLLVKKALKSVRDRLQDGETKQKLTDLIDKI